MEETGYDENIRGEPFNATIMEFKRIKKVPINEILEAIIDVLSVKSALLLYFSEWCLIFLLKNI